jgi:hypothetical protein
MSLLRKSTLPFVSLAFGALALSSFAADAPAKKAEIKAPAGVEGDAQCHKQGNKHHHGEGSAECDKACCKKDFHGKHGFKMGGMMGRELVATTDGGVVVLMGKDLIKFDKNLKEVAKAELPMPEGMKAHKEHKKEMKKEAKTDGKKDGK